MPRVWPLVLALAVAAGISAAAGSTSPVAATVVDRTYLCTNTELAGVRKLEGTGRRGFREGRTWKWLGSATVLNRGAAFVQVPGNEGVRGISDASWSVDVSAGSREAGVEIVTRGCTPSSKRPALTPRSLSGGEADFFGDYFECRGAPPRVLVRLRGEFATAVGFRRDPRQGALRAWVAKGPVRAASFVVATPAGRRIAFGRVVASGRATFFAAAPCVAR